MGDTEEICVFVPQQKTRYPKLASLWRGPLEIKKNISDVLYEIDCFLWICAKNFYKQQTN
jgi:hypothetical protein